MVNSHLGQKNQEAVSWVEIVLVNAFSGGTTPHHRAFATVISHDLFCAKLDKLFRHGYFSKNLYNGFEMFLPTRISL